MDRVIIHVKNYRKGISLRYIDANTGEILYDMEMYGVKDATLSDIIRGIEKMSEGRFGDAAYSWDVNYSE